MPRNMTMHQPGPRIINLERNPHITPNRTINHIPPRGVIQIRHHIPIENPLALSENHKIVPVQMDRVHGAGDGLRDRGRGEGVVILNDEVDPFARLIIQFYRRGARIQHCGFGVRGAEVLERRHPPVDILCPVCERPFVD